MDQTIIGVFESESKARGAEDALRGAGFSDVEIRNKEPSATGQQTTGAEREEGGITGFFRHLFGSDDHPDVSHYSDSAERGRWIVIAYAESDTEADRAQAILEDSGAIDIDEDQDEMRGETSASQSSGGNNRDLDIADGAANTTIPVVEEQLQVGKRAVERGHVRIYTRTTERPVEQAVNLREQHILIERRPVDRAATSAELSGDQDRVLEIRTIAEEPVVAKTARVVEEVEIGRDTTEHTETIRDTVRRRDVEVEPIEEENPSPITRPTQSERRPGR